MSMQTDRFSLSQTLTIAIVGCVLLVSSAVISVRLYITSQETWKDLENQADEYSAYLSGSLSQPLWTLDEDAVRRVARIMFRNDLFVRLKVKGSLLKIVYERWAPSEHPTISRKVPIMHKDKKIGTLELEISTGIHQHKIDNQLLNAGLTVTAVLATLFILTGLIFNRLLKRPMTSLLNRIDHLSQGKPVPSGSGMMHKELNQIIARFDEMAQQVTKREESLLISKRRLEVEIAERKQAEADLKESEKRYRQVTDMAPVGIIVHRNNEIVYANAWAVDLFGASGAEDLLGNNLIGFVHPDDRHIYEKRTALIMQSETGVDPLAYRWINLGGQILDIELVGTFVNLADGPAILSLFRDLTQHRRDETDKARLLAQLQQSQKMEAVGTLANGIAHDFNNILQAISGIVQLMSLEGERSPEDRKFLKEIDTSTIRGSELVGRLLTFSRKVETKLVPVDLNQEVARSIAILERTLPKMIQLNTFLDQGIGHIRGDVSQLEHVIFNLGTNAGDAMPDGGVLSISTSAVTRDEETIKDLLSPDEQAKEFVKLTIQDTGEGMEQSTLEQIFDPFFTTKEVGKGTGLGLSTVYGIVQGHKGHIVCHSKKGQGTSFDIYFPVYAGDAAEPEPERKDPEFMTSGQGTILLVDDEPSILAVAESLLSILGYSVRTAISGEEALEHYRKHGSEIDAIIMDMGMPGMGGMRCLQELIAFDPRVRVLVASGYAGETVEQDVLDAGAQAFMRKPYRLDDLLSNLTKLLTE